MVENNKIISEQNTIEIQPQITFRINNLSDFAQSIAAVRADINRLRNKAYFFKLNVVVQKQRYDEIDYNLQIYVLSYDCYIVRIDLLDQTLQKFQTICFWPEYAQCIAAKGQNQPIGIKKPNYPPRSTYHFTIDFIDISKKNDLNKSEKMMFFAARFIAESIRFRGYPEILQYLLREDNIQPSLITDQGLDFQQINSQTVNQVLQQCLPKDYQELLCLQKVLEKYENMDKLVRKWDDACTSHKEYLGLLINYGVVKGDSNTIDTDIGRINSFFGKYTIKAVKKILQLRILQSQMQGMQVYQCQLKLNNEAIVQKTLQEIAKDLQYLNGAILALDLYSLHAVGIVFIKRVSQWTTQQQFQVFAYYIDPLNKQINEQVAQNLNQFLQQVNRVKSQTLLSIGIDIKKPKNSKICALQPYLYQVKSIQTQKYANCGPEVVENVMLFIQGTRYSQELAPIVHSQLYEQSLIQQ